MATSAISSSAPVRAASPVSAYSQAANPAPVATATTVVAGRDTITLSVAGLTLQLQAMQEDLAQVSSDSQLSAEDKQSQEAQLNARIAVVQAEIVEAEA